MRLISDKDLFNLHKKKKKVGAFHSDINTLMVKKSVNLKNYANKAIDTRDFLEQIRVEETTQTVGIGILLSELALEENKKNPKRKQSNRGQSYSAINFEQDIDNILIQETKNEGIEPFAIEDEYEKLGVRTNSIGNTPAQTPLIHNDQIDASLLKEKQNKLMVPNGLKAGILQKVIEKLKENFKKKEIILKQLVEENKDLFSQLDIEKAKFQQVIKFQGSETCSILDLQNQIENMQLKFSKERSRHHFYKDVIQQLSELKEVKQKINMSISDVDDEDFENDFKLDEYRERDNLHSSKQRRKISNQNEGWDLDEEDDISNILNDNSDDELSFNSARGRKSAKTTAKKKKQVNQQHPSNVFLVKVLSKLNVPKFQKLSCSLKTLLKTINLTYSNLLIIYKKELYDFKTPFNLKQSCTEFIYDQFMRSSGIKKLAEKKFAQTIAAVMRYKEKIQRVRFYGRFIGLYDSLDKESFKFYLLCLNYLLNVSTFGYLVPANDTEEVHYTPYIRVNDFMRTFFEYRISNDEYQDLKAQIDKLKENDFKKNRNTYIVELDQVIEILAIAHMNILNQKRGHVKDLFHSFDFNEMEIITIQAFYLLMSHVEEKSYSFLQIKQIFDANAEIIQINQTKDTKKFLTLDSFISVCFQEKLFNKDSQQYFLMTTTSTDQQMISDDIEEKFKDMRLKFNEEIEIIKKRFYGEPPLYIKDMISYLQSMIISGLGVSTDQGVEKHKHAWILMRVLQEESKRYYIEKQASYFMGILDCFIYSSQGGNKIIQEERQLFDQHGVILQPQKKNIANDLTINTFNIGKPYQNSGESQTSLPKYTSNKLRSPSSRKLIN